MLPVDLLAAWALMELTKWRPHGYAPESALLVSTLVLGSNWLLRTGQWHRVQQSQFASRASDWRATVPMAIAIVVAAVELVPRIMHGAGLSIAVGFALAAAVFLGLQQMARDTAELKKSFRTDPVSWLEAKNEQVFRIVMAQILGARMVSILAIPAVVRSEAPWMMAGLSLCTSLMLLLHVRPLKTDLMAICGRCGAPASAALKVLRLCPQCAPEVFRETRKV